MILLAIFMAVNLALIPIAYVKTVIHKAILFRKYKGGEHSKNLLIFLFLGIPFLLVS